MSLFASDKKSSDDSHINVIAEITAKPEYAEKVKALLTGLVEPARAEDGCKDYHLLVSKTDPASFYTFESWTSEEKLHQHLDGAKSTLDEAKPLLMGEMKLTILNHLV